MERQLAVVVLNYNGRDHLKYSVPSIEKSANKSSHLIMVDNCSTDGGLEHFLPERRWSVLSLKKNLGWAGGNNFAIRHFCQSGYSYVLLLNNDVEMHSLAMVNLCEAFRENPDYGVLGFTVYEGGETAAGHLAYQEAHECCTLAGKALSTIEKEVGGMAMGIRVDCLREVGLFDEAFFAYGEEVDFIERLRKTTWKVGRISTPVWHYGGGGFRKIPMTAKVLQIKANIQLALKHRSILGVCLSAARFSRRFTGKVQTKNYSVESRLSSHSSLSLAAAALIAVFRVLPLLPGILIARVRSINVICKESPDARSERMRLNLSRCQGSQLAL